MRKLLRVHIDLLYSQNLLLATSAASVVMDEVLVEPPYESSEKCIKSNNLTRKERVMKVLLGETTKLQQTRPELWS